MKIIDDNIRDEKLQYKINREVAKKSDRTTSTDKIFEKNASFHVK